MQTFQQQKAFFDGQWDKMKAAAEAGGGTAVAEYILGFDDELERRVLFVFARTGLVMQDWEGKNFDDYITVCDAGIAEVFRQAEAAEDEETRAKRRNAAHVISYNLTADLADCWPGDDDPREKRHFERGRKAAEDCLEWCPPDVLPGLSMDWWAKGMHELSLGAPEAASSFEQSLDLAVKVAEDAGQVATVSPEGEFGVILGTGYLGLARMASGDDAAGALYVAAVSAFGAQLEDEEKKDDAGFGISQLEKVREKVAGSLGSGEA